MHSGLSEPGAEIANGTGRYGKAQDRPRSPRALVAKSPVRYQRSESYRISGEGKGGIADLPRALPMLPLKRMERNNPAIQGRCSGWRQACAAWLASDWLDIAKAGATILCGLHAALTKPAETNL